MARILTQEQEQHHQPVSTCSFQIKTLRCFELHPCRRLIEVPKGQSSVRHPTTLGTQAPRRRISKTLENLSNEIHLLVWCAALVSKPELSRIWAYWPRCPHTSPPAYAPPQGSRGRTSERASISQNSCQTVKNGASWHVCLARIRLDSKSPRKQGVGVITLAWKAFLHYLKSAS